MNQLQIYEVEAKAFHIMTGKMAPGKDCPAACGLADHFGDRMKAFLDWRENNHEILMAMRQAFEDVME